MADVPLLWPKPWSGTRVCMSQLTVSRQGGRWQRCGCVVAAKKEWEEVWEPREVTLDKADLMQLEMRRMLGEDRYLRIAKMVAKKLNPSATNLQVDKIVKQKGVKTFLDLLSNDSSIIQEQEAASPAQIETSASGSDADPVRLSPRPCFADGEAPPSPRFQWSNSSVGEPRKDLIQLSPKPGVSASPPTQVKRPNFKLPAPKLETPEKPVPELQSRPSRGGASTEMFPAPGPALTVQAPQKLLVPNLNSRPQMPQPVAEEQEPPGKAEPEDLTPTAELPVAVLAPRPQIQRVHEQERVLTREDSLQKEGSSRLRVPSLLPGPEVCPAQDDCSSPSGNQGNNLTMPSLSTRPMMDPTSVAAERQPTSEQEKPGQFKQQLVKLDNNESELNVNDSTISMEAPVPEAKANQRGFGPETELEETLDSDWALAEVALDTKSLHEVLFVGSNVGGLIVRFGKLSGFLPGKDLLESRGLKTFKAWARERGHNANHTSILDSTSSAQADFAVSSINNQRLSTELQDHLLHPACDSDLEKVYREERLLLLSSLVGQRAKVIVTYVDKSTRKLVVSERKAALEDPDIVQRRVELMANLKTGDIVEGRVKNISLFGVFVELVEGVSGLIHFSELSWAPVSDPAKFVNVGQDIETLVHKLDYDRQRIYLSLKRMSPDPLLETVESMLSRQGGDSSVAANDVQVLNLPELETLINRLGSRDDIQEITRGRRLLSTSVVPTFQVYLSSDIHDGGYKLLARFGNQVQEILLRTTLERSALKYVISEYTTTSVQEDAA